MCLAFGVDALDDVAAKLGDVLEMQPPAGARRQGARPAEAEVDRRLAAEDGPQRRRARRSCSTGDDVDLDLLPIQTLLARRRRRRSSRSRP